MANMFLMRERCVKESTERESNMSVARLTETYKTRSTHIITIWVGGMNMPRMKERYRFSPKEGMAVMAEARRADRIYFKLEPNPRRRYWRQLE